MAEMTISIQNSIDKLLMENGMEDKVKAIVRNVLKTVRNSVSQETRAYTGNDVRHAYKAVKRMVYRSILGGNVSILNKRRSGTTHPYTPVRKLRQGQVGGNRRARSERTNQVDSYYGSDRGFILRFLNSGTDERYTKYGRRGHIAPRNFFGQVGQKKMEIAAENLTKLIELEIQKANI